MNDINYEGFTIRLQSDNTFCVIEPEVLKAPVPSSRVDELGGDTWSGFSTIEEAKEGIDDFLKWLNSIYDVEYREFRIVCSDHKPKVWEEAFECYAEDFTPSFTDSWSYSSLQSVKDLIDEEWEYIALCKQIREERGSSDEDTDDEDTDDEDDYDLCEYCDSPRLIGCLCVGDDKYY